MTDILQTTGAAWGTHVAGSLIARPRAVAGLTPLPLSSTSSQRLPDQVANPFFISPLTALSAAARHCSAFTSLARRCKNAPAISLLAPP